MKRIKIAIVISCIFFSIALAERPTHLSAIYVGAKMWNTERMMPFFGSVSLEIIDTIAYCHYNKKEADKFTYDGIHNDGFRYIRRKSNFCSEYLWISKDSLRLQVGEPGERNYFYNLKSIKP